jgi:hypothetical protein
VDDHPAIVWQGCVSSVQRSCSVAYNHLFQSYPGSSLTDTPPPTCQNSQFDIIFRRQRSRPPEGGGLKLDASPSRFLNLTNDFEFAGWGSSTHLQLGREECTIGEDKLQCIRQQSVLGQFTASALAGNAVLGSVFYALPAVVAVSSV